MCWFFDWSQPQGLHTVFTIWLKGPSPPTYIPLPSSLPPHQPGITICSTWSLHWHSCTHTWCWQMLSVGGNEMQRDGQKSVRPLARREKLTYWIAINCHYGWAKQTHQVWHTHLVLSLIVSNSVNEYKSIMCLLLLQGAYKVKWLQQLYT